MKPILGLSTSAQRPSPCVLVPIPERESVVDAAWGRYASLDQVEVGTVVGLGPFQRDHQSVDRHPRGSVTLDLVSWVRSAVGLNFSFKRSF